MNSKEFRSLTPREQWEKFESDMEVIETSFTPRAYIHDPNVAAENALVNWNNMTDEEYTRWLYHAGSNAFDRAMENYGFNLNDRLGYSIN